MKKYITLSLFMLIAMVPMAQYLSGPQKIVIDTPRNRLLVSNGNNGNLVVIDSVGVQTLFVENADFIDGLEIVGDTIYGIGFHRKVHAYNLETREHLWSITITGNTSKHLSSITSDSAGHLFISSPPLNEIYKLRISDQSYWVFAGNQGLRTPNGILLEKEKNRIVTIGDSPSPSLIQAISLSDSTVSTLDSLDFSSTDGITRDKYGYHYLGGYSLSGVYQMNADFSDEPELIFPGAHIIYPTYDSSDHSLLVTYYGLNTWARIPLTTTGVYSQKSPDEFILYPVYPNPSNTELNIRYDLNKRSHVRLELCNYEGNLIVTLVNKDKDAGNYSEIWCGQDSTGKYVSSGTYYLRMSVNGIIQTQKVIMIR
ncbi:MAG: hypothetical protein A2W85_13730 [Bacteroidetes bacterium GWF2_41_31]|nr:MAG: hypothetical protein A2W85_13730 [Bacteroidetes bacterium GWF2_41_31]